MNAFESFPQDWVAMANSTGPMISAQEAFQQLGLQAPESTDPNAPEELKKLLVSVPSLEAYRSLSSELRLPILAAVVGLLGRGYSLSAIAIYSLLEEQSRFSIK